MKSANGLRTWDIYDYFYHVLVMPETERLVLAKKKYSAYCLIKRST